MMRRDKFFAGDWVVVRSPQEILSTLDSNGTLDAHPFMPEMLDCCGKSFRVHRRVEKTCVDVEPPIDSNRRFAKEDVVTLEGLRCDGSGHDGCKRGCRFYWKEAWLQPADGPDTAVPVDAAALAELRAHLKVKADEQRYFCQSTELFRATEAAQKQADQSGEAEQQPSEDAATAAPEAPAEPDRRRKDAGDRVRRRHGTNLGG
jgi:hypothetical protein